MAYHHRTTITPTAWATAAAETQWVYQCASDDSNPANGPEKSSHLLLPLLLCLTHLFCTLFSGRWIGDSGRKISVSSSGLSERRSRERRAHRSPCSCCS